MNENITLASPVTDLPRIGPAKAASLKKLGIMHARDLLFHFPRRYEDFSQVTPIAELKNGEQQTVFGRVKSVNSKQGFRGKSRFLRIFVEIEDDTGVLQVMWFNMRFLPQQLREGRELYVAGTVEQNTRGRAQYRMRSPAFEFADTDGERTHTAAITPIYPETQGVTSRFLRYQVKNILPLAGRVPEYLPEHIRTRNKLVGIQYAIKQAHFPDDRDAKEAAWARLRFDELFFLQLAALLRRAAQREEVAQPIQPSEDELNNLLGALDFELTGAQQRALREITADMARKAPMNRLLQGDVGSGKSALALLATQIALRAGYGVLYLAPTEVLARQQADAFRKAISPPEKGGWGVRKHIPYESHLKDKARKNRKNPTEAEKRLWNELLRSRPFDDKKFLRQKPLLDYIVDFYCPELMLAIEIDGDTHDEQKDYDRRRTERLGEYGITVLRYTNDEILQNLDGVYDDIAKHVQTHPSPPLSGRESTSVELLIGSLPAAEKRRIKERLAAGEAVCTVGTHALLQDDVGAHNIGLVIVDEQHRFGVNQRAALIRGSYADDTRINADRTRIGEGGESGELLFENLTYSIRGAAFDVANELGLGLNENVYQQAFAEALKGRDLKFEQEKIQDVKFHNKKVGTFRPDFVVDDKIIVELKALPFIGKTEKQQLWTYVKGSDYKLGLIINFGAQKLEIERVVYDEARSGKEDPRKSASYPRQSAQQMRVPHLLTMTATPIPRTLNLTVYGDLDVSVLDELPPGRKPVKTRVIGPDARDAAIVEVLEQLNAGRQGFVIAPLVEASEKLEVKSAKETYAEMEKLFPGIAVGLVHGQMKSEEKEAVMRNFAAGAIQLLVSTAVVEVGVNVPNATVMIIEGAERFGLAQLHQFRGRIGRGAHQSTCYLFPSTEAGANSERLAVLAATGDGFKIAEEDLRLRGPGEVYGAQQSGFSDLKVASLLDYHTIKAARAEAERLLKADSDLEHYEILRKKAEQKNIQTHFE